MSNTTRWSFNNVNSINQLFNRLKEVTGERASSKINNFKMDLYNSSNKPMSIKLDGVDIKFYVYYINYIKVLYDGTTRNEHNTLILYSVSDQSDVYGIIDKNSGAKTLLRYIFLFSGRKEVTQINNGVSRPLIIWLIKSIYNKVYSDSALNLDTVLGFSGKTDDLNNSVRISGSNMMNLLSSLSFLLESNKLSKVDILFSYKKHKYIKLHLSIDNLVGVKEYLGEFTSKNYLMKYGNKCIEFLPCLLIYCDILPKILIMFRNHMKNNDVDKLYVQFLKELAEDINNHISTRLKEISKN